MRMGDLMQVFDFYLVSDGPKLSWAPPESSPQDTSSDPVFDWPSPPPPAPPRRPFDWERDRWDW
jgi:hypothetical protein